MPDEYEAIQQLESAVYALVEAGMSDDRIKEELELALERARDDR